jgi:REP element-mobilizing transposase RayT
VQHIQGTPRFLAAVARPTAIFGLSMHPDAIYAFSVKFFDPYEVIRMTRHRLPHWEQPGATYFITFRLGDSVPQSLLRIWREERSEWLAAHPEPHTPELEAEYHLRFSDRIDQWLDAGHGSCLLAEPPCQEAVADALRFFDGQRYELLSWVIMPNHVHVCLVFHPDSTLKDILFSWKRRSAGSINRALGTSGPIWMRDYFDRIIRDENHLRNVVRYIRRNPGIAKLSGDRFRLWESEMARTIE